MFCRKLSPFVVLWINRESDYNLRAIRIILRVLFFVFVPAFLAYLASDKSIIDNLTQAKVLGEKFNVSLAKQIFLIVGILIGNLLLVVLYELKNNKSNALYSRNIVLINQVKTTFLYGLGSLIGDNAKSIKLRVFREEKNLSTLIKLFKCWIKGEQFPRVFRIVHVDGLSDNDVSHSLAFEVYPQLQGLVSECYNSKEIKYEEDISTLDIQYNLTPFQVSKTRNTKFCLAIPIFNTDNNIVTIITLDCIYSISISNDAEVANMINVFTQDLSKFFPKLYV
ncbi:hypothetical protein D3C75_775620 [compost metagenome]